MLANMKIFDCSLREIGYQTGWYFDKKFCQELYRFAESHYIDYMELGFFHNPEADPDKGAFRYCNLRAAEIADIFDYVKNRTKLSAMRDIQRPLTDMIPKSETLIDAVRILTRSHETDPEVLKYNIDLCQSLGYEVFVNFTSAGANTMEQNRGFAKLAKEVGVEQIYFADTESIMTPDYVRNTIEVCKAEGVKVGMHLHDKNGTAEALADLSIALGVDGMDITHLGLGGKWRDGNLTMDYLMRKFNIPSGYEMTMVRNEVINQLIKFHEFSAAE